MHRPTRIANLTFTSSNLPRKDNWQPKITQIINFNETKYQTLFETCYNAQDNSRVWAKIHRYEIFNPAVHRPRNELLTKQWPVISLTVFSPPVFSPTSCPWSVFSSLIFSQLGLLSASFSPTIPSQLMFFPRCFFNAFFKHRNQLMAICWRLDLVWFDFIWIGKT